MGAEWGSVGADDIRILLYMQLLYRVRMVLPWERGGRSFTDYGELTHMWERALRTGSAREVGAPQNRLRLLLWLVG